MIFFFIKAILAFAIAVNVVIFVAFIVGSIFAAIGEGVSALKDRGRQVLFSLRSAMTSSQDPWTYPE